MERRSAPSTNKKESKNIIVTIVSAILIIFAILCIFIIFKGKNFNLLLGVIGIILLVITMNVAARFKVNKYNSRTISIICLIASAVSIIFAFKQILFSFVLIVPSFILSLKCKKVSSKKDLISIISLALSSILLIAYFGMSVGNYFHLLNNKV